MITPNQQAFLQQMYEASIAAALATVPWPLQISRSEYARCAACESVQETGWGEHIPNGSKNVLGIKAFPNWTGASVGATGTEQSPSGAWSGPQADRWCVFPTYAACFAEQLRILQESRYASAVAATDPLAYIAAECKVWSTGVLKGQSVTQIYNAHAGSLV